RARDRPPRWQPPPLPGPSRRARGGVAVHRRDVVGPPRPAQARGRARGGPHPQALRGGRHRVTEATTATTTVERTVHIAAEPELVWSFWTDPARIVEWWGRPTDVDVRPGGVIRVELDNGATAVGTFTALEPPRRLVFT